MKYIDGNIISYDPPTTERGSLNTGESGVEMLVMEADIDNVKTDTGKTYCIGMGSYSVFKNHSDCVGVTDLLIRDLDAEKENKEDSQVRVEYDDIWTIEYGKWNKAVRKNKSVTIVVMLVIMLAIVLSACTVLSGGDTEYVDPKTKEVIGQAKTMLQG